jgi:hypothetical protein
VLLTTARDITDRDIVVKCVAEDEEALRTMSESPPA